MAPTFPTTFEKEQSPMSPMSAGGGGNTPISYKANVNRMKTKKWADAKPADYGGDDWGDEDEYDLPPPPISKPTGLRQQGQGLQSGSPSASTPTDKKTYGDLRPLPGVPAASSSRPRANSFDADDEKRNFSNSTVRQPSPPAEARPGPATRFSEITGAPSTRDPSGPPALSITTQKLGQQDGNAGFRKPSQVVSPMSDSPHPDILKSGPGRTNTSDSAAAFSGSSRINTGESGSVYSQPSDIRTPSSDYQARRDFSLTAVPAPLSTTRASASPAPQSATDTASARFPARKSSLSQSVGPDVSQIIPPVQEAATPKPWVGGRSSSPGASARSPITPTGKALPFIRPADIYRRMEEEKERERQSMDSGRPSMDSIAGAKSSDRPESPAKAVREKTSSDSLGGGRQRTNLERDDMASSSRHLAPMLEPVKERKSEYGFDGFNVNEQAAKAAKSSTKSEHPSKSTQLDIEKARSSSVSPKLPDLNRMSGFGIDMFGPSKLDEPEPPSPQTHNLGSSPVPLNATVSPIEETPPERQPALGYKSVVNQAFDVPQTPASQSGSEVRRSDSESTGTTGISPIKSRAPSGAVSDIRGRDGGNPSILEVVQEPSSPSTSEPGINTSSAKATDHAMAPVDEPGYRRDIRTPSPGNSPARAPKTEATPQSHEAVMADPSLSDNSDEESLHPHRPITEREGSFRPSLPGGWTSYATTARSETPQLENSQASREVERSQTPTSQVSSTRQKDDDYDITPTTTRNSLPQNHSALGSAAGAAFGEHDEDKPVASHLSDNHAVVKGESALPTPDSAMAPSGNVYSAVPLDPRLLPKLESVSPEAQLPPAPVQAESSEDSSVAPTPPAKDTPVMEDADYFPKPTAPLKQRSLDQVANDEALASPTRPQVLPTLSTDTRPQDEESDKLRKEIIKSLSPRPSDASHRNDLLAPGHLDDQTASNDGRLSYLPREYDNYWATNNEDVEPAALATPAAPRGIEQSADADVQSTKSESPTPPTPPIPPLSARRTSMTNVSRPPIPTRFSWETTGESVNIAQAQEDVPEVPAVPYHQEPYSLQTTEVQDMAMDGDAALEPSSHRDEAPYSQSANLDYDKELGAQGLRSPVPEASDDQDHTGRNFGLLAGGAVLGGAAAVHSHSHPQAAPSPQHERRLSLVEEKDPRVNSYPVSPTPPEEEHPARSPQAYYSAPSTAQHIPYAPPSSVSPINSPTKTQFSPTSRILAFKEIAAMKNPHQRIQTFDDTRQRFAGMDSGLIDWISALKAQHPEHAHATGLWSGAALPGPNGSVNSKYAKPTGQAMPALQQPYYQQYLDASSPTTPETPVSRPGPSIPSGSQGFSPAGGKLSTQQVQAKGKELLHTAGIFGGKAGKAGKGLFAKGKNKLRGSGAGDKTSPNLSPPAKPKNERRTSWGFPVGASRSSSRPDTSARESRDSIPMPIATPERQRADTTNSQGSIPLSSNRDSPKLMSGAVGSAEPPRLSANEPEESREPADDAVENHEGEDRDRLGVPPPISKNRPSWDPINATPIAEEEGFQYEDRQEQQPQIMRPAAQAKALAIPGPDDAGSKSERSNSGDAQFYDASEDPSDLNDWIMVSPAEATKQTQPKADLQQVLKAEEEVYQAPEGPPPSFLRRQQTQPIAEPETVKAPAQLPAVVQSRPLVEPPTEQEVYTAPEGPPPSFLRRQQEQAARESMFRKTPEIPAMSPSQAQIQPKLESEIPKAAVESSTSVLNRPHFSYEAPVKPQTPTYEQRNTSHYSPLQQNFVHSAREQQFQQQAEAAEPSRNASFKGLPPIRRTSTFGLGFGPRKGKQRFPIDDEDESLSPHSQRNSQNYEAEIGAAAGAAAVATYANHEDKAQPHQVHHTTASTNLAQQRKASLDLSGANRSELNPAQSSEYAQPTMRPREESQPLFQAPRATDVPLEGFRRSQDAWRPNAVSPPVHSSHTRIGPSVSPQRPSVERQRSMESQRQRAFSDVSQTTTRPDIQYNDRGPRPISNLPVRPALYDQPPSSAQRYPELFQSEAPLPPDLGRDGELPPHMYQAPIPREVAFLPRQQMNEYQLPGVGPPTEEPRPERSRRNSGTFFKDLGGRISRGTSRERGNSISREGGMAPPERPVESRGYDYAESSVASEEGQDRQKRRSSFFGNLDRASTNGLEPPQSRESVIAHFPRSRTDLLGTPQQSPVNDKKGSLFGRAAPGSPNSKPNKLSRASTSRMMDEPGKKKRFSGFSSMFSRNGNPSSSRTSLQDRPQAVRQLSNNERQPLESPQFESRQSPRPPPPVQNERGPSQQRQFLAKLSTGGDPSKPREASKTRRPSASNLLSGFMGRKDQKDRSKDDSSSQGTRSQASQQYNPQQIPLGQTYTDLQEESPQAPVGPPPQQMHQPQPTRTQQRPPQPQPEERGRRASREPPREIPREPQYASVPIPGGYDLVRGDGAIAAPTGYDPRGLARIQRAQQTDPRYMHQQPQGIYPQRQTPLQDGPQRPNYEPQIPQHPQPDRRTSQGIKPAALAGVESYENYTKRTSPRFSHEDLLARSPAREQPGQQRPYQLSLPEGEEDRDHRPNRLSKSPPIISPPGSMRSSQPQIAQPKHNAIQRLQQPLLRHPESPAGYPLPEDAAFSPINEAARDVPPPPPPKWPSHLDAQQGHVPNSNQYLSQHLNLESELDRSNTRRTAVSAVSGMSGPLSAGLHPPGKPEGRDITPSPTPPSPAYTPEREQSPPRYSVDEKELERGLSVAESERERGRAGGGEPRLRTTQITARGPSPDLYSASPRLPPTNSGFPSNGNADHRHSNISNANGNGHANPIASQSVPDAPRGVENDPAARRAAEIEAQKRKAQEEKIYYDAETGEEGHHEEEPEAPSMSATSYPGMEWNPYIAGGYEDYG